MFHVAFTPATTPTNALSAKGKSLIVAIGELLKTLEVLELDEWFVGEVLFAIKEAVDNLDKNEPAKGTWSDMGCEDDAFSIDIFCEDDAKYVKFDNDYLLAPHGAVALAIGEHNFQRWIYDEAELPEWDNILRPIWADIPDVEERCEHTGMTRNELESLCGTAPTITEVIRNINNGDCTLSAIRSDGSQIKLFSYFIDELSFSDAELIGLTETEAHELHRKRDTAYLRS